MPLDMRHQELGPVHLPVDTERFPTARYYFGFTVSVTACIFRPAACACQPPNDTSIGTIERHARTSDGHRRIQTYEGIIHEHGEERTQAGGTATAFKQFPDVFIRICATQQRTEPEWCASDSPKLSHIASSQGKSDRAINHLSPTTTCDILVYSVTQVRHLIRWIGSKVSQERTDETNAIHRKRAMDRNVGGSRRNL